MSKKNSYLLGIFLTIILGSISYYYLCCNSLNEEVAVSTNLENPITQAQLFKDATKTEFSIIDAKSGMAYKNSENFNFKASSPAIKNPISESLSNEVEKLTNYLNNNKNKVINITGYYTSKENNNTAFPNLGLARANAVKNFFVSKGASTKSITVFGNQNNTLIPDIYSIYFGPLKYELTTIDLNNPAIAAGIKSLEKEIKDNPIVMHFDIGNTAIRLSAEQREKVAKITRYIDKTDNISIQIIGHTDNIGDRTSNITLGQNRANFAKDYFIKNGIPESKIQASSKGPDMPIAKNNSKEGQAKNRRIIITIN